HVGTPYGTRAFAWASPGAFLEPRCERICLTTPDAPGRACATKGVRERRPPGPRRPGGWLTRKTDQPCTGRAESTGSELNGKASGQQGLELGRGDGVADPVALGQVAAAFTQDRVLPLLLHALGHDGDAQRMG